MLVYLRCVGCERPGALVGALAFSCAGYVHSHAVHPEKLRSVLAIPWALAAIEALAGRRLVAGLGAAVAVLVAGGHPQTIAFALAIVGAYGVVFAAGRRASLLAGLTLGVAVPAVTWLPAIELVWRSSHLVAGLIVPVDRLPVSCAHTLVVPFGCGGGSSPFYGISFQRLPGCGLVDCSGYPGMLVWLVLLAGLGRVVATSRGRLWTVVAVAGVVLATGVTDAIVHVPGVRAPSRALLWWSLGSAAAAGLAWPSTGLSRRRAWWGAALVLLCVIAWAATRDEVGRRAALGSLVVLAGTLLAARVPARWPVVAALVADLVLFGTEFHAGVRPTFADKMRAELRSAEPLLRAADDPTGGLGRVLYVPTVWQGMWAQLERIPILQGWNVLVPARLTRLLGRRAAVGYDMAMVRDPALLAPTSHVLDLLRVRLVAVNERLLRDPRWLIPLVDESRWILAARARRGPQYAANERARPVGWLVHGARIASDDEALALVRGEAGPFDPTQQAIVTEPVHVAPAVGLEEVRVIAYDEDAITLAVCASAAALLVTSELASPGWEARVGEREATLRTVNAGFRAVEVPAGEHEVVFRYRPPLGHAGLVLSLVAATVLGWCAFW
jgi:hypothetical protein